MSKPKLTKSCRAVKEKKKKNKTVRNQITTKKIPPTTPKKK